MYSSPDVTAPSDVWAGSGNKSSATTFRLKGYGGDYKIKLFYQRSKTATGA